MVAPGPSLRLLVQVPAGLALALAACRVAPPGPEPRTIAVSHPDELSWDERLAAHRSGVPTIGFSRVVVDDEPERPVAHRLRAGIATASQRPWIPGTAPILEDGSLGYELEAAGHAGPWLWHVRPELLASIGDGHETLPNADPRDIWTGDEPLADQGAVEVAPRATAGLRIPGHVLALSTEPFRWGQGIFGGIVVGQAWEGFPHVVLLPDGERAFGELGGDLARVHYEFVVGQLVGTSDIDDDPLWMGGSVATRWRRVELGLTTGMEIAGEGQDFANIFDETDEQGADTNIVLATDFALHLPRSMVVGFEYGVDDAHPKDDRRFDFLGLEQYDPHSAGWTATFDWLDVAGDGRTRVALEWFRTESYFYRHSVYGDYDFADAPLAHQDGANSNSLRLLFQHRLGERRRVDALLAWWRRGWRNAESGNPNEAKNRSGPPGGPLFAERPWDRYGLLLRYRFPIGDAVLELSAAADHHDNFLFVDGADDLEGTAGLAVRWGD